MNNKGTAAGIGLGGLSLFWGIITQCLSWASVVHWPWYAIWGPFLIIEGIMVIAVVVSLFIAILITK